MALTPGMRLGAYEIGALVGAGGMGEVYRARDTRLDRTVAIKVLTASVADSPQRRERFEREARAISSLNHPHICALYDVGDAPNPEPAPLRSVADSPSSGEARPSAAGAAAASGDETVRFLVLEYLEGQTLAERLTGGPLAPAAALRHAIEICSALDKAHRSGIVHRDLKPANVMLTKAGVKLLDFGLAKSVVPAVAAATMSMLTDIACESDRAGDDPRHAAVHGTRTSRRARGRRADRHLRVRHTAVRDANRSHRVRRQHTREPAWCDSQRRATFGVACATGHTRRARPHHQHVSGEGSRRSVSERARSVTRPDLGGVRIERWRRHRSGSTARTIEPPSCGWSQRCRSSP